MLNDVPLIWKFRSGDSDALAKIYEDHRRNLLRIAAGLLNHLEDPGTLAKVATVIKLKDGTIHNSLLTVDISAGGLFFGGRRTENTDLRCQRRPDGITCVSCLRICDLPFGKSPWRQVYCRGI